MKRSGSMLAVEHGFLRRVRFDDVTRPESHSAYSMFCFAARITYPEGVL